MRNFLLLPSLLFALLWIVVAFAIDGTTFHLAPVIAGAASALRNPQRALSASLGGGAIAVVVALGLSVAGVMDGPSLLPVGGALLESVVFAILGGAAGAIFGPRLAVQPAN